MDPGVGRLHARCPSRCPSSPPGAPQATSTTGGYLDYRNLNRVANGGGQDGSVEKTHTGLMFNQWLGTVLQAMGVEPAEYEQDGVGGYGVLQKATETWFGGYDNYDAAVYDSMGQLLPFLKA